MRYFINEHESRNFNHILQSFLKSLARVYEPTANYICMRLSDICSNKNNVSSTMGCICLYLRWKSQLFNRIWRQSTRHELWNSDKLFRLNEEVMTFSLMSTAVSFLRRHYELRKKYIFSSNILYQMISVIKLTTYMINRQSQEISTLMLAIRLALMHVTPHSRRPLSLYLCVNPFLAMAYTHECLNPSIYDLCPADIYMLYKKLA